MAEVGLGWPANFPGFRIIGYYDILFHHAKVLLNRYCVFPVRGLNELRRRLILRFI